MSWITLITLKIIQADWIEIGCRFIFLTTCIALGVWIGS
jgi:hypothetical protein